MKYISFLAITLCSSMLFAQVPKQLYISNDEHTDYMWTGNETQYRDAFIKMLDFYIAQSDSTAGLPSSYQGRFNCDGTFWLWEYEKHKTAAEFQKLISKIKSGHISVPYNALVSCYGAMPTESVLRGMYYAGYLERKYALDLNQAVAMENQTMPLGLSSLWAGTGAKYSWKGVCGCVTKVKDLTTRNKEIYWYKGLDNTSVLMKWYSMGAGIYRQKGGYCEARDPELAVEQLSALCNSEAYPYHIAGSFGYGGDDLQNTTNIFIKTAQQKTTSEQQVVVSNQLDFFETFEAAYGKVIPSETLSFGNEWDLYSASMAELSSQVKRSLEKLRAAEAMAALVAVNDKDFGKNFSEMRKTAWMALGLYYEHDWTADGPVTRDERAAWQRKIEAQLTTYVDTLYTLSQQRLGTFIKKGAKDLRFYAFNPLSWKRTDVCDFLYSGSKHVRVVDVNTGKEVASQIITTNGKQYIRILAADIPAVGYKVFEVRPGNPASLPQAAIQTKNSVENDLYKVTFTNQGVITSLIDKTNGNKECVANINGKFMNDLGSGTDNTGTVVIENVGPVSVTISCTGKTPLSHTSRITLFKNIPRIDIHNQITQNFSEIQSWAFSYNLPSAEVWHEELGTVIKAKPFTEGGHYATQNARFDWLTLNHFADINVNNYGITLSNADCAFMKLGNSEFEVLDTQTSQLSILAGGQVDGEKLGILKQGGDSLFTQRFALGTHANFDAAASMRFSLEHQNPLVAGVVTGKATSYPDKIYSFLTISDPNVLLWSLKPAEDDIAQGIIARVWNFGKDDATPKISFDQDITSAYRTTHVETDTGDATVVNGDLQERIGHHQIKTFRILLN